MGVKVGKDAKVTLGAATVLKMGTWNLSGITTEEFDASSFQDEWKLYEYGMKDGGNVGFNGHYDPTDTTGQQALQQANLYNSALTTLRLYVDNTSYFEPCQTTGYFSPNLTTGAPTILSSVTITSLNITADKSGLESIDFGGKVSGLMVLV
jgi:hypothetical protein